MLPKMDPIEENSDPSEAAFALYPPLRQMFAELSRPRQEVRPSKYGEELNRMYLQQLVDWRYETSGAHQLQALPHKSVDMFVNISSLHEMRMDQIRYYFAEAERLTRNTCISSS